MSNDRLADWIASYLIGTHKPLSRLAAVRGACRAVEGLGKAPSFPGA
ncbi:MAG: hypothetical protein LBF83_02225 [Spirochaetaceae bacterium]|nr:hypothetical protein [Spirochaetaceae bacterium]